MRVLRFVVFVPISIVRLVAIAIGLAMNWAQRLLRWMERGYANHVYYPLAVITRWSMNKPTWIPEDLIFLRRQPRTAAHRELADKDSRVVRADCDCGNPDCMVGKSPVPIYVPVQSPAGAMIALRNDLARWRADAERNGDPPR